MGNQAEAIKQRLAALRGLMEEQGVDYYYVPTEDFHASEYVGEYFKCRKYLTGFSGSAGTALVGRNMAGLWTDGRYFIQAADQLSGTGIELFCMGEEGVPEISAYLKENVKPGQVLGYDGRVVSSRQAEIFHALLAGREAHVREDLDLVGEIWADRPALSAQPACELDTVYCGESRRDKLERIRAEMEKKEADAFLLTSLDDIAWLLNLRGKDVACCPVALSFFLLKKTEAYLYINPEILPETLSSVLKEDGICIRPYMAVYEEVKNLTDCRQVMLDKDLVSALLTKRIPENAKILDCTNPTLFMKAVKNPTEAENMRMAHIRDGVALVRFIRWLKLEVASGKEVTELSAADRLFDFRSAQDHFLGNSFDPIIAYGDHAAICHYSATRESSKVLQARGLVLADTGGQYLEGTTDVTRTIVLGETTQEEKKLFTAVLKGHLRLAGAVFRHGCTGANLDILARGPLWELGLDYNHGTGHGVGYYLNVHEGPQRIHWKPSPGAKLPAVLEPGMVTSDEPGYYAEGKFGIRHENLILCKERAKTPEGRFLCFEPLTMVPFDLAAVLAEDLTQEERNALNCYHKRVRETLTPYLNQEEAAWLEQETREI